jgi:carboxypeptidase family protein/TonB-dependent receptor-like protein
MLTEEPRLKYSCVLCLLLLSFLFEPYVIAQSTDATVSGQVVDTSGRIITNADIEILNESTGIRYPSKTNSSGIYSVSILPPGHYRIQVSKTGFKTLIKPGIVLNVQSAMALNFTLPVGAVSESVTVEAGSSMLNTTDASVSTVIDRKFVQNIPLNGRSFQDLISMTPGVVTQSPQSASSLGFNGDFSVNGQRTESNYYTVDGVSGNTSAGNGFGGGQAGTGGGLPGSTALGTTQSLISVDALQEFRVLSSTYSAEFGRTPGGQFSFATRSGANSFHGSAFDYLRNNYFDANDWFNDLFRIAQPALRQNDFGGTIGGPVWIPTLYNGRDKTFFFISYEGLRLAQPQAASLLYVPSTNLRASAPSALQPILNAYPLPTGPEVQVACNGTRNVCPPGSPVGTLVPSGLSPFIDAFSLPADINSTSVRIDHIFFPKLTMFFRYGDTPSKSSTRDFSSLTENHFNTRTYTIGATSQFSNRMSNDFRLGFAQSLSAVSSAVDAFGGATPVDLAEAFGAGGHPYAEPFMFIFLPGVGRSNLAVPNSSNVSHQWNTTDTFNFSFGRHQLKFGIDYRHINSPLNPSSPLLEAIYESRQSLLTNQVTILDLVNSVGSEPVFNKTAAFAQDEWHITPSLNLSLGLRWEINPPPHDAHGNDAYTLLGSLGDPGSLKLAPQGTPLWKTTYYNLAPRLGLAWQAHMTPGWETVIRTGGGVFFDTDNQLATQGYSGGIGFSAVSVLSRVPLPVTEAQLDFSPSTSAPYTSSAIYAFPPHLQLPYTLQWNLSIQQAMGRQQAFTLSYVGSNGRRLIAEQELFLSALNPNFGTVLFTPSGGTSNYQALQAQFQRSVTHGVQALASYTWSHSIDLGSAATALPLERGNSDFDVRNNFSGGLSWDLPDMTRGRIVGAILSHWGLDGRLTARSGFPVTLNGNLLTDPATGNQFYSGVDLVPGQPIYRYGSLYPGGRSLNPSAFSVPTGNNSGDSPRNFARGFGATQVNLSARREFQLRDRLALQFRAEAFNLLNHPNFGLIDATLTDATFGQATQMLNQSLGTVASQYQQGGPRSMQFALKATF